MFQANTHVSFVHLILFLAILVALSSVLYLVCFQRKSKEILFLALFITTIVVWAAEVFSSYFTIRFSHEITISLANIDFANIILGIYFFVLLLLSITGSYTKRRALLSGVAPAILVFFVFWKGIVQGITLRPDGFDFRYTALYSWFVAYLITYFCLGCVLLFHYFRNNDDAQGRKGFILLSIGLLWTIFIGIILGVILPYIAGGTKYDALGPLGVFILIGLLAFAVFRHGVLGIRAKLTRIALVRIILFMFFVVFLFVPVLLNGVSALFLLFVIFLVASILTLVTARVPEVIDRMMFVDALDSSFRKSIQESPKNNIQIEKLQRELKEFFGKFIDGVEINVFYLEDRLGIFRSVSNHSQTIGMGDRLATFVRANPGLTFGQDLEKIVYLSAQERRTITAKMGKLNAEGCLGMRHWTGELVIIALLKCKPLDEQTRKKIYIHLHCLKQNWDEIAGRIFANKRAIESI